jgi:hypothetical protein
VLNQNHQEVERTSSDVNGCFSLKEEMRRGPQTKRPKPDRAINRRGTFSSQRFGSLNLSRQLQSCAKARAAPSPQSLHWRDAIVYVAISSASKQSGRLRIGWRRPGVWTPHLARDDTGSAGVLCLAHNKYADEQAAISSACRESRRDSSSLLRRAPPSRCSSHPLGGPRRRLFP